MRLNRVKSAEYRYGFHDERVPVFETKPGLNRRVLEEISSIKEEPDWMRKFRLDALEVFLAKPMPTWGADLAAIDFEKIVYYAKPSDKQARSWDEVPEDIKNTFEKIGVPEAERKFFAGAAAQYDSDVIYHAIRENFARQGVIFCDTDTAVREYPDLVKEYFGTIIPIGDNKFAALNSACWSGGSFIYVPRGVKVEMPLQAYFRINSQNFGQFERTLIIVDEGSEVQYLESCTAPVYSADSLHAAVVEIIAKPHSRVRYITVQNWSNNVYNLVTKRAKAEEGAFVEWIDCNIGCLTEKTKVFVNPKGPVSIKDLKSGDTIYTTDLNSFDIVPRRVKTLVYRGNRETFRLLTTNHREIEATENHPFLVMRSSAFSGYRLLSWQPLKSLKLGDWIGVANELPDDGMPFNVNFAYDEKRLKQKPSLPQNSSEKLMWLLGLYLGDGYIERSKKGRPNRVYFAVPPQDRARKKLEVVLENDFKIQCKPKGICVTVGSTAFAEFIIHLGFEGTARTKKIPSWVFSLPKAQKLAFIEGYFDADGYTRKNKITNGIQYGQIVFASCNKELLEDLKLLMISVGLEPLKISSYVKERKLYKDILKEYTTHYLSLNIRGNLDKIRGNAVDSGKIPLKFVRIASIEPIGHKDVYDIEVEGTHNFIANGILVHNSKVTMKYPSVFLFGRGARADTLSIALAGPGQHQDAGAKMVHIGSDTISNVISKSVSFGGGRTSYRGLSQVVRGAKNARLSVRCDALILDPQSRSDTYPTQKIDELDTRMEHEAKVSRMGEKELFYLRSRGLSEVEASSFIVTGFFEPLMKYLPVDYAVEMNRLIQLEMEGAVG